MPTQIPLAFHMYKRTSESEVKGMYGGYGYDGGCTSYGYGGGFSGGGYGYGSGAGSSFVLIVVLFILLIIVGASFCC